ncbi:MAG: 30S ribosomal protein S2 [Candidatus Nomurabacteria bacterium]|jgi:small subunit ribosomal protein S2|nr:30S ribosomal protein S2 [Candidatus Nomurabacteria bacterium]
MSVKIDLKALFEAGAHFGHKTSRWHPKMAQYIHSKRGDSHIINLDKTVEQLERALPVITKTVEAGKQVLFVGTKKQTREIIRQAAVSVAQPYVVERWVGGMLTNTQTISSRIKNLKNLEKRMASGELANRYNKLEVQRFQEQIDADNIKYGGIKELRGKPGILFVADAVVDDNAVKEANKLGVPVVALADSNTNPTNIDYVIPANDDAIGVVQLMADYVTAAVQDGQKVSDKKTEEK